MEQTILEEAQQLVYGNRDKSYGTVTRNFDKVAKMWSAILDTEVTAHKVGLCMVALKIARECYSKSRDNLVDGAGYFATLEKLEKGE